MATTRIVTGAAVGLLVIILSGAEIGADGRVAFPGGMADSIGVIGGCVFFLAIWRGMVNPILSDFRVSEREKLELDLKRAEIEEIRFRSQFHIIEPGERSAVLSTLPAQISPPPPVYTPPPTPPEGGGGESINLLPIKDSAGRVIRYANIPPRALRRYSEEQFREIERLLRERPEMPPSAIAEKILGNKGGYQNKVVTYLKGETDPPWVSTD